MIAGAKQGMLDFPGIQVGIIDCMMHKGDSAAINEKENLASIEAVKTMLGKGAVGIDLPDMKTTAGSMTTLLCLRWQNRTASPARPMPGKWESPDMSLWRCRGESTASAMASTA